MSLCDYQPDADGWTCSSCGDREPKRKKRACPAKAEPGQEREPERPAYLDCPHRGAVVATITGRVAGCGCFGSTVEVYQCSHFREPVIKQGHPPCMDTLREKVPGATGRTCRECKVPMQAGEPETIPDIPPPLQTIGVVVTSHTTAR